MSLDELKATTYQISTKTRAFRTVTKLFELSLQATPRIDDRDERLPDIEDICDVLYCLAQQADELTQKLLCELPTNAKGITP